MESTLGRLGTVGAIAVDEFIGRLKSAMQEVSNAGVAQAGGLGGDAMELPMTLTRPSVGSVICPGDLSISSRQGSLVPSAFGDVMACPWGLLRVIRIRLLQNMVRKLTRSWEGF